jgi:hypothetical protein
MKEPETMNIPMMLRDATLRSTDILLRLMAQVQRLRPDGCAFVSFGDPVLDPSSFLGIGPIGKRQSAPNNNPERGQ